MYNFHSHNTVNFYNVFLSFPISFTLKEERRLGVLMLMFIGCNILFGMLIFKVYLVLILCFSVGWRSSDRSAHIAGTRCINLFWCKGIENSQLLDMYISSVLMAYCSDKILFYRASLHLHELVNCRWADEVTQQLNTLQQSQPSAQRARENLKKDEYKLILTVAIYKCTWFTVS